MTAQDSEHRELERYRTLFQTMVLGVVYQDQQGQIIDANPASERILGLTLDQMRGLTSLDPRWRAIHEDGSDYPGETHPAVVALQTGEPVHGAIMGVYNPAKDDYRWIRINATPQFRPTETTPYQVYVTLADITEEKALMNSLEQQHHHLAFALQAAKAGTWAWDIRRNQFSWDVQNEQLHGLAAGTFGNTFEAWRATIHPEDLSRVEKAVTDALNGDHNLDVEYRIIKPDGSIRYVRCAGIVIRDAQGEAIKLIGLNIDINDHKQAQQHQEQLLDDLSERLKELTLLHSASRLLAEHNTDLQTLLDDLVAIIPKGWRFSELTVSRIRYETNSELIEASSKNFQETPWRQAEAFQTSNGQGVIEVFYTDIKLPVGQEVFLEEEGSLIFSLSQMLKNHLERRDTFNANLILTQELEQRVAERTRELELLVEDLESFNYSVSHDLRTPLRSIAGFSQAFLDDYGDQLDEEGLYFLQNIHATSQHMDILIDDLLRLSRITQQDMHKQKINLSALAHEIAQEFQNAASAREIEFMIEEGLSTEADGGLISIMLSNLISNAVKYSSHKAKARIEFGETKLANGPAFFVKDNGAGFNMDYAAKLFQTFARLHSEAEFEGNGVGLAIVKRIIDRHQGSVWGESVEGQGATFFFTLPTKTPKRFWGLQ